jgi:hypothetical protein
MREAMTFWSDYSAVLKKTNRGTGGLGMDKVQKAAFDEIQWQDDGPGIRAQELEIGGERWAIVEYDEGIRRDEWCEEGHRGYVISGAIQYEFDDGREPLRVSAGQAFRLPSASLNEGAHRGGNLSHEPTRLFLIDDP